MTIKSRANAITHNPLFTWVVFHKSDIGSASILSYTLGKVAGRVLSVIGVF